MWKITMIIKRTKTKMIMVVMVVVMMIVVIKTNIWIQACGEESLFIYPDLVTCLVITKLTFIPHNDYGASSSPPFKDIRNWQQSNWQVGTWSSGRMVEGREGRIVRLLKDSGRWKPFHRPFKPAI